MTESKARLVSKAFTATGDIKAENLDNVPAGFDSADVLTISAPLSNRNLIINGAMQVWQRGTSKSLTTSDYFIADRWINYIGTAGAGTASQQAFTVGQTDVAGEPEFYLRHAQTTGASSAPNIQHRIEGVRTGAGQSVTLSFYAKVASGTLTIDPIFRQYFGTGGSPSSAVDNTPTDITVTTSWQKFERTIVLASINGKTVGTDGNDAIQIRLQLPTSTTFTLDIAQVQLEVGDTATPFEHRSYGDELARCGRYYQKWNDVNWILGVEGTRNSKLPFQFSTLMRANPTCTLSGGSAANGVIAGTGVVDAKKEMVNLHFWLGVGGSLTNATFSGYTLVADAEL